MGDRGPVTIITGTRQGIGRSLAGYYLEQGWTVAGCSRGESDLEHERYSHPRLDVADEKAVAHMVREVATTHGRLDAMINNAGIASMNHTLLTPLATVEKVFATNVHGTFLFCREADKAMLKRKTGRIVNCGTVATPLKLEGDAAYAASKAAVGPTPVSNGIDFFLRAESDFITGQTVYLGGIS